MSHLNNFLRFLNQFLCGKRTVERNLEGESKLESESTSNSKPDETSSESCNRKSRFVCETCGKQAVVEVVDCCFGRKFDCRDAFGFSCIGDLKRLCGTCADELAALNCNEELDKTVQETIDQSSVYQSNVSSTQKPFLRHTDSLILARETWKSNKEAYGDCMVWIVGADAAEWGVDG